MTKRRRATAKAPSAPASQRQPGAGWIAFALLAVAAITVAAYAGAFDNAFVQWDDPMYIVDNPSVLQKRYDVLTRAVFGSNYHPLTMVSYALNVSEPLSPRPFIVTNVIVHAVNTGLVFWLSFLLSRRRLSVAILVALLFGIHPMHVESVAWISERKDVLYVFFLLTGAITYWRYLEKRTPARLGVTFLLFLLACLSKGMAVVFPVLMVLLDYWKRRPIFEKRAVLEKIPFFATALLFGLIALNVQSAGDFHGLLIPNQDNLRAMAETTPFSTIQRITLPTYGHMMYVAKLFAPVPLAGIYPYPSTPAEANHVKFLISFLFFLATLAIVAWDARRTRVLAFGVGWYLVCIVPVLQWIPVGSAIMADRYSYLSYFGLLFALAMGIVSFTEKRRALRGAVWVGCAVFAVFLFARTVAYVETWRDTDTLWTTVIKSSPRSALAYATRGNLRGRAGRIPEALNDLQTARMLDPGREDVYEDLGNAYAGLGKPDSALAMLDQAVRIAPTLGRAHSNRAILYLRLGRPTEALSDLAKAQELAPEAAGKLHFSRGNGYLQLGRVREAVAEFDRAIEIGDGGADAFFNRGLCKLEMGDRAGAAADFRGALRLDPGHAGAIARLKAEGSP
jgi:tetratricopeptide (TPR) repeat protein